MRRRIQVFPVAAQSLTLSPGTVKGGQSVTGTVVLRCAAQPGGVTVELSSSNTAAAMQPRSFRIAGGETVGTFTINTTPVTAQRMVIIRAFVGGKLSQATLTITP